MEIPSGPLPDFCYIPLCQISCQRLSSEQISTILNILEGLRQLSVPAELSRDVMKITETRRDFFRFARAAQEIFLFGQSDFEQYDMLHIPTRMDTQQFVLWLEEQNSATGQFALILSEEISGQSSILRKLRAVWERIFPSESFDLQWQRLQQIANAEELKEGSRKRITKATMSENAKRIKIDSLLVSSESTESLFHFNVFDAVKAKRKTYANIDSIMTFKTKPLNNMKIDGDGIVVGSAKSIYLYNFFDRRLKILASLERNKYELMDYHRGRLVTVSTEKVEVFSLINGELECCKSFQELQDTISSVKLSDDWFCQGDQRGRVELYETDGLAFKSSFLPSSSYAHITALDFLDKGTLFSGSADFNVKAWDVENHAHAIFTHRFNVTVTAIKGLISRNFLAGDKKGTVKLFDLRDKTVVSSTKLGVTPINAIGCLDSTSICIASSSNQLYVYDLRKNQLKDRLQMIEEAEPIISLDCDNQKVVYGTPTQMKYFKI